VGNAVEVERNAKSAKEETSVGLSIITLKSQFREFWTAQLAWLAKIEVKNGIDCLKLTEKTSKSTQNRKW
jgi:hypothetical protein